jgi:Cof subfamily protein (haloacid dehalogenase superfamily)
MCPALHQELNHGTPESMSGGSIKALAIDVDGTLLDNDHRLRDPVRDALHELVANQTHLILATARGPQALAAVLRPLRLSPMVVCFSGAWVGEIDHWSLLPKRAVLDRRHRPAVARSIVASALELKVEPNVFTLNTWRARQMTPEIRLESQITECTPLLTATLLEENNDPSKILLMTGKGDSSEPLHVIAEAMQNLSNATFSKANYLEIIPLGTNKAEALRQLIATLGLDLSQLAAIGDGLNDLEMLREAGLGIAMGNAPAAVQSVADWVTSPNDQAGVAEAVRRLFQEGFI